MQLYRFLSDDDSSAFCRKVSGALAEGWVLHGGPVYAFDASRGAMRCGQAVIKEVPDPCHPQMSTGEACDN